jgi:hypothetical protein
VDYGELVKSAFWLSLRNRYLWFFGFFAGGSFSNFGGVPNVPTGGNTFDSDPGDSDFSSALALQPGQGIFDNVALLAALAVVGVLIALTFVFFSLVSQGALAESVAALDRGEARRFGSTFRAGVSNFWRVLGYYVLLFLISLGFLLAIGLPLVLLSVGTFVATESMGARIGVVVLAAGVSVLLLIAVFVPLFIIGQFALRGIVVGREGIAGSIGSGYRLFRRNLGRSLLVWLINLGLAIGIGIALLILALIVGLILFLPTIALGLAGYSTAALVTGAVAALILVPLLLVASGAIGTFNHSYWTLAYLRLDSRDATPEAPAV